MAIVEAIPGDTFFNQNLPRMVDSGEKWVERMERIIQSINLNLDQNRSGTKRVIAGKLLDMVIRRLKPSDTSLEQPFNSFSRIARPYLVGQIRAASVNAGIDPDRLRGRRLVFGLGITANEYWLTAYWAWSTHTGVLEIPANGSIPRVVDYTDTIKIQDSEDNDRDRVAIKSCTRIDDQEGIANTIRKALFVDPLGTTKEFVALQIQIFSRAAETTSVSDLRSQALDRVADAQVMTEAGAIGPELGLLVRFVKDTESAGLDPFPDVVCRVLCDYAGMYGVENTVWGTVDRWFRAGVQEKPDLRSQVQHLIDLAEKVEPGYLGRCIESNRIYSSKIMSEFLKEESGNPRQRTQILLLKANRAILAWIRLRELLDTQDDPPMGRLLYKKIGRPLMEALRLNLGHVYETRINHLLDNLIGGQHQMERESEETES